MTFTREQAEALLFEFTKSDALRAHARGVEAAMRALAARAGADEATWGLAGLLHDFDWEIHPTLEQHPADGAPILRERGCPEPIVQAILGHGNHTGVARDTDMARALFAVDELVGLVFAVAMVRPSKRVGDVEVKSVKKKLKDKRFAAGVNRDDVRQGAAEYGVELDALIAIVIDALREVADDIGL